MADQRFFAAFLTPSRTTILGFKLRPFCIQHRIWLEGIASPFIEPDRELTPQDLIIALKICAGHSLDKPTWKDRWIAVRMQLSPELLADACKMFVAYMTTDATWPKFYQKKDRKSGGSSSVPWQLSVVANLVKHGITYQDAMQMPEAKAIWLSTVFSIHDGAKLELLTTDDEDLIAHLNATRSATLDQSAKVEPTNNEQ